jgi:hypothetical protein
VGETMSDQPELFEISEPYRDGDNPLPDWNDERIACLLDYWKKNYF